MSAQIQFWSDTSWDPDSNNDLDNHLAVLLKEAMILASPSAEDYSQYQHISVIKGSDQHKEDFPSSPDVKEFTTDLQNAQPPQWKEQ